MTHNTDIDQDPFDVYVDRFEVTITSMGASLQFSLTGVGTANQGSFEHIGTIRMSNELLKLLAYYIRGYIIYNEQQLGVEWPVPGELLALSNIPQQAWDAFWGHQE